MYRKNIAFIGINTIHILGIHGESWNRSSADKGGCANQTTVKYYFIPMRMVTIKKLVTSIDKDVENTHCWWECKMVLLVWNIVCQFSNKLNRTII
jgi:hypothetical protein